MATITINGQTFKGDSVSIIGGRVIIDGIGQPDVPPGIEIRITEGVLQSLTTDSSVNCLNVAGNVNAGGSVNCDDVRGSVHAGGSVNCDDVGGSATAGGSVRHG